MGIYAISDLHLSFGADKPMDIFGPVWEGYIDKLKENWIAVVKDDDTVLIPGDISWAKDMPGAKYDFLFLDGLPGRKVVGKGNHDFWWNSLKKLNEAFSDWGITTVTILHNNSCVANECVLCGTRGWKHPDSPDATGQDKKIYERELNRLRLSLESAKPKNKPIICGLHFPPFGPSGEGSPMTEMMSEYGVAICVYGHIHKNFDASGVVQGNVGGIVYKLISGDYLQFKPYAICP